MNIVDDAPKAVLDTDTVAAGTYGPESGNVIDGIGTTSGEEGMDTLGADGASVTGIRTGDAGEFSGIGDIKGQYGTLNISADGSYVYVRDPACPAALATYSPIN